MTPPTKTLLPSISLIMEFYILCLILNYSHITLFPVAGKDGVSFYFWEASEPLKWGFYYIEYEIKWPLTSFEIFFQNYVVSCSRRCLTKWLPQKIHSREKIRPKISCVITILCRFENLPISSSLNENDVENFPLPFTFWDMRTWDM